MQYSYDGLWKPISVEWETFRVKTDTGLQDRRLPLYYTNHGPIVHFDRVRNIAYSVKLPNADGVNYSKGLYEIMKAQNLEEFKNALSHQFIPRWNFLYSDTRNIFWVHNALVAQRPPGYDWTKPVPGWTSKTEWGPFLPFSILPQVLNPRSGFLQNCNNPPWVVTTNSYLKPLDPAPYYLQTTPSANTGREVMNTRAERMFQVLEQDKKFTLDEMKELAFDTYIVPTDVIIPLLDKAFTPLLGLLPYSSDERILRALNLIKTWDRRSSVDSVAFTYLYYWGRAYEDLYSAKSFARFLNNERRGIDINSWLEQRRARTAFEVAISRIETHFGKTEVPWGSVNFALRGGTFAMDGNGLYDVLHPDSGSEQPDGTIHNDDGWGHLMVVLESQPKVIWSLLPYGQSEDPTSPHYNDQTKLHRDHKLKRFWFSTQEILDNAISVLGDPNRLLRARFENR
jgi:acyl-homoserine lactone acylase PvdQ